MAINWVVALKAVPWTDLVQAAPAIVKGARRLFSSARAGVATDIARSAIPGTQHGGIDARLAAIEAALDAMGSEQRASAELIRSLAEQNARVIETMAIMRARARILLGLCIALSVALIVLALWVGTR
ncbi:MAG: hypothetical protein IT531_16900 [Burkholderiales bacterium]|nr:hypothetical protein [Burkholderiales bacterium]